MDRIRCAVIGAGWWGTTAHVPAIRGHPRAELLAVQTQDAADAKRIAADFEVPHGCATIEEVLALKELDAAVISSTPNAHYAQARACLERGLHVLIEKPMTFNAAEAGELVALAEAKGVHLMISCPWHYTAHAAKAQELIRSGALGQLKMISLLMTNFTDGLYKGLTWDKLFGDSPTAQNVVEPYRTPGRNSYSDPSVAGGGQIYCQVSHAAGYLSFLTGQRPASVFARFDNGGTEVDVYDTINARLADGTLVSLASTGATMLSERNYEVRIYGTQGMLLLELWKGQMAFHKRGRTVERLPDLTEEEVYPMEAPTRNLIDAALGEAPNTSPGVVGLHAMELIEAACRSVQSGRDVAVSDLRSHGAAT